jgi:hypothetical protein
MTMRPVERRGLGLLLIVASFTGVILTVSADRAETFACISDPSIDLASAPRLLLVTALEQRGASVEMRVNEIWRGETALSTVRVEPSNSTGRDTLQLAEPLPAVQIGSQYVIGGDEQRSGTPCRVVRLDETAKLRLGPRTSRAKSLWGW